MSYVIFSFAFFLSIIRKIPQIKDFFQFTSHWWVSCLSDVLQSTFELMMASPNTLVNNTSHVVDMLAPVVKLTSAELFSMTTQSLWLQQELWRSWWVKTTSFYQFFSLRKMNLLVKYVTKYILHYQQSDSKTSWIELESEI